MALVREDLGDALTLLVDDPADLVVDGPRCLLAVFDARALVNRRLQHEGAPILFQAHLAETRAHPEGLDHAPRDVGRLAEIVVRARRYLVEDQLLGGAAAKQRRDLV